MQFDKRLLNHFDTGLLAITLFIPICGLVVLYSAGIDLDGPQKIFSWLPIEFNSPAFAKQIAFIFLGFLAMLVGAIIPTQYLYRAAYPVYALSTLLLAATLLIGKVAKGSRRWLVLGGVTFQPSEMMKLALILGLARFLCKYLPRPGGYGLTQLILPFLIFGIPMLLIMKQPDLGTAMAIGAVGFSMVLFMGIRPKAIFLMLACVAVAAPPLWKFVLHDYQKSRVLVLFDPETDPLGTGYHIIQSKIAVGSGGFLGKGFLKGTQTQLEFLPEHTTDFIFSVLAEEWGFLGSIFVVLLFGILTYRLLRVVMRSKDLFSSLVAFGICAQVFCNAAINIGMVIGLLPVVGLPLPLFSYGGTSLISTMFAIGLVLGIEMRRLSYLVKSL